MGMISHLPCTMQGRFTASPRMSMPVLEGGLVEGNRGRAIDMCDRLEHEAEQTHCMADSIFLAIEEYPCMLSVPIDTPSQVAAGPCSKIGLTYSNTIFA